MSTTSSIRYGHGTIAWTELFAGDLERQRHFYGELFGWRFDPRDRALRDDRLVAALRQDERTFRGWAPGIAVDDVEAVLRATTLAGGTVVEAGVLDDPLGGRFLVWDGNHLDGPHRLDEPGGMAWNESWSSDPTSTTAFYRKVVGWNLKEQPGFGGAPYTMFAGRDRPSWTHAGIRSLDGADPSSRWMSYFEVESCAASVEAARTLGARITLAPTFVPGVGWLATASDLEGSWFGLTQSSA